jgi:hypothetical protein
MKLLKSQRKITHLTNEEIIYNKFVKTGRLEIDSQGRIWRNSQKGHNRAEVIISHGNNLKKVAIIVEYVDGKTINCTSARLVWLALRGRIPHMQVVTTKNGDKTDTRPKNLFLCTQREATIHGQQRAA